MIFNVWVETLRDWFTPPPELTYGPRRMIAWLSIMTAIGIVYLGVRTLDETDPLRIFVEGLVAMLPRPTRVTPDDGPGADPVPVG